jgi:hypothetical protein
MALGSTQTLIEMSSRNFPWLGSVPSECNNFDSFFQFSLLEKHFTYLPPNTTCFGLAGHLQVCLTRVSAAPAMQWSASTSGFGRVVFYL